MRRVDQSQNVCPVARSLGLWGDGWSLLLVRDAFFGKRRFSEFEKSLGAAKNILAARLKALVAAEIFECVPASDGAARSEYVLTEKGQALAPVLDAISTWGEAWCAQKGRRSAASPKPEVHRGFHPPNVAAPAPRRAPRR